MNQITVSELQLFSVKFLGLLAWASIHEKAWPGFKFKFNNSASDIKCIASFFLWIRALAFIWNICWTLLSWNYYFPRSSGIYKELNSDLGLSKRHNIQPVFNFFFYFCYIDNQVNSYPFLVTKQNKSNPLNSHMIPS